MLAPILGHLGPSWGRLGPSWAVLAASWGPLGAGRQFFGCPWAAKGTLVGVKVRFDDFTIFKVR